MAIKQGFMADCSGCGLVEFKANSDQSLRRESVYETIYFEGWWRVSDDKNLCPTCVTKFLVVIRQAPALEPPEPT